MRQVSKYSAFAFLDRIVKRTGKNTEITFTGFVETNNKTGETTTSGAYFMKLHGNDIACLQPIKNKASAIQISLAGWNTVTTRERLNALLRVMGKSNLHIVQHKHKPYLATFEGNKRLLHPINDQRWYDVTELEHTAHLLRVKEAS